jgi:hypothetical protein
MVTSTGRWVHREKTGSSVRSSACGRTAHSHPVVVGTRSEKLARRLGRGPSTACRARLTIRCSHEVKRVRSS